METEIERKREKERQREKKEGKKTRNPGKRKAGAKHSDLWKLERLNR